MKKRSIRGYTLIELAIVISVLGLIAVLLWRFGSLASQRIAETESPQILADANQALIGFAMVNHRLPCPDTSATGDGLEHCGGAVIGRLPIVTLGLARADMQSMRYGVFSSAADSLDTATDRFTPLVTYSSIRNNANSGYDYGSATASETLLGAVNGIDFCDALRLAGTSTADVNSLNIRDSGNGFVKNIAYALALPGAHDANGDGQLFDGANVSSLSFAAPSQPVSANYDDVVLAVDFGQLFDRMSCGGVLSAADHAHFNAATAAALTHADFVNYKSQLQLAAEMAYANYLLAVAAAMQASGDVSTGIASILFSTADALVTGNWSGLPLSIVAEVFAAAALVTAGLAASTAHSDWQVAVKTVSDFQPLLDQSSALELSSRADAIAADAAGLY